MGPSEKPPGAADYTTVQNVAVPPEVLARHKARALPFEDELKERDRRRQRKLMELVIGRSMFDIGGPLEERRTGADMFMCFLTQSKLPQQGEKVIALLLRDDQGKQSWRFEQLTFRDNVWYFADGKNAALALMNGDYNW